MFLAEFISRPIFIPHFSHALKKSCVEMIKGWVIDTYVTNDETYMYLTIGFYNEKIRYVPSKLNRHCDLIIKNNITDEIMVLWWYSGDFESDEFITFFGNLLCEEIKDAGYYFQKVMNGIYILNIDITHDVSSIYKFEKRTNQMNLHI